MLRRAPPTDGHASLRRRPLLLGLVFGVFLVLIGITATAQAILVSVHFSSTALTAIAASDAATIRAVLEDALSLSDLDSGTTPAPGSAAAANRTRLATELASLAAPEEILRVELRRLDGTVVAASDPAVAGAVAAPTGPAAVAAGGHASIEVVPAGAAGAAGDVSRSFAVPSVLREFLPISSGGRVRAVLGIWRDAGPVLARLDGVRRDVVIVTLSAALVAALVLFLVFRSAQIRLSRQTVELVDATRRDLLTGVLNHGALVTAVTAAIDHADASDEPLAIAAIDLDNFRLLNDNHGHAAGDAALVAVTAELVRHLPSSATIGRSGPDEFVVVVPSGEAAELEPAIERMRSALAAISLQFDASERLPLTVSAGLCAYPDHGASATGLLATADRMLEEAKASGGDRIRVAGSADVGEATASGFDVLQGLVIAVDTKDRYTKRHSEDVARYSVYLARRLGLDADLIRTIHLAGLLHDVGKIGIPDAILRKPGKLTDTEFDIVRQHVALGEMIVRDVPDVDLIRAGIRHHHERWDGDGYLDRLEGEHIPLIARILAVGDTFSAMTTTRPYRKALDLREAITRLEDAAGTQLEERLVMAFVAGLETDADAPLPGATGSIIVPLRSSRVA